MSNEYQLFCLVLKRYVFSPSLHFGSYRIRPRCLGNETGGFTPGHDGLRHFAGCLVDHLVAEHDRAALVNRGGMGVRLDDRHGAVMLGDEMIDEASRKMAEAIVARG